MLGKERTWSLPYSLGSSSSDSAALAGGLCLAGISVLSVSVEEMEGIGRGCLELMKLELSPGLLREPH